MRLIFPRRTSTIPALLYFLPTSSSSFSLVPSSSASSSSSIAFLTATSAITPTRAISSLSMSSNDSNIGLTDIGQQSQTETTETNSSNKMSSSTTVAKPISSWREKIEISSAKSRKIRGGNYVQIATVDPQTLEPRCRTVVFRGFLKPPTTPGDQTGQAPLPLPCTMKMITDKRSNKFQEVISSENATNGSSTNASPIKNTAEMVWWFSKSSEQYRIRGQLKFIGANGDESTETNNEQDDKFLCQARKEQWGNLSDMAREQFYWVHPGKAYDEEGENVIPTGGRDENGKVLPPPDNFLLMLLYPTQVDYLRLSDNYRQVDCVKEQKEEEEEAGGHGRLEWDSVRVTP